MPGELAQLGYDGVVTEDIGSAIRFARTHAERPTTVVVCGTLYLVGEARAMLE